MEGGRKNTHTLFLLLLVSFSFAALIPALSASSAGLQFLFLRPLPSPPTLTSWPESKSESDSEASTGAALSMELRHIDALSFNLTPQALFQLRLRRDASRVQSLSEFTAASNTSRPRLGFSSSIVSGLSQGSGEYFTRLGVGTPPRNVYMVLDTGSDIVWIQCAPYRKCYSQTDPVFDPSKSTSFAAISCSSDKSKSAYLNFV